MRAFMAIEVPEWYAGEVAAFAQQAAKRIPGRFVPCANYHVTLAFLGDVDARTIDLCADVLDDARRWHCAVALEPDRLGSFGRRDNAALWLGFAKTPELMELGNDVRRQLDDRGIAVDPKPFLPHMTLARHADLSSGGFESLAFPCRCMAWKLTLFKSTLAPEGASYEPLHTVELPGLTRDEGAQPVG